jgi:FMN phosphatase YigB (HAD superfamily)
VANIEAVIFDYYETLVQLPTAPRERAFDELARRVGVDLPPGEAYRHWRELTTKDW